MFNGVGKLYVSLQLYCWAILQGYLWRHISYHGNAQGPQKRPLNFSLCKLSEKLIRWPTIFISLLESSLNSLTFHSMEKIYLVELNIFKEKAFHGSHKIPQDNFSRNFYIWSAIVSGACMQKIKIGHRANFRAKLERRFCTLIIQTGNTSETGLVFLMYCLTLFLLRNYCPSWAFFCRSNRLSAPGPRLESQLPLFLYQNGSTSEVGMVCLMSDWFWVLILQLAIF